VAFRDMMAVISQHVPSANTGNIAVSGFSLGGKMAHRIAASNPEVTTLSTIHGTIDKLEEQIMAASMHRHPIDVPHDHTAKHQGDHKRITDAPHLVRGRCRCSDFGRTVVDFYRSA
jgi:esterase/lipase